MTVTEAQKNLVQIFLNSLMLLISRKWLKHSAVIMGGYTYEMADPFLWVNDDYEFQVPSFVLTHTPPAKYPKGNVRLSLTFVADGIESAISQAKKAAGNKIVYENKYYIQGYEDEPYWMNRDAGFAQ